MKNLSLIAVIFCALNQLHCAELRPLEELADKQVHSDVQDALDEINDREQQRGGHFERLRLYVLSQEDRFKYDPDLMDPQIFHDALKKLAAADAARHDADFAELLAAKIDALKKDDSQKKQVEILEDYFAQKYGSGERSEILKSLKSNASKTSKIFEESYMTMASKKQEIFREFHLRLRNRGPMQNNP